MKRDLVLTLILAIMGTGAAVGQQTSTDLAPMPSRWDLAAGYNYIKANAPPGDCGCFNMNGAFVSADVNFNRWLGAEGQVTAGHATKISSLGQNLTLTTFMGGPRISWVHFRYVPFAEFLAGGARGTGSYFPSSSSSTSSATSFAYSTGGGVDWNLTQRIAVRAVDVEYLHTAFPNAVNGSQHQLQIGAGVVIRFGSYTPARRYAPAPRSVEKPTEISFSCSATNPEVVAGQPVQIVGQSTVTPPGGELSYTWSTGGGIVRGEGQMVTIDTAKLMPGRYKVIGRASMAASPSIAAGCEITFDVKKAQEIEDQTMPTKVSASPVGNYDDDPREHLHDVFFSYDKADLRPDDQETIIRDAAFLVSRPDVTLTLAGYADERGSAEYNIALGLQRAIQTRKALVAAGVPESRIEVLSYGKEKPFCTDDTEDCFQQNRRAQFVLNGK